MAYPPGCISGQRSEQSKLLLEDDDPGLRVNEAGEREW